MKKTVLVVEDERLTRTCVVDTLEKYAMHCIEAANGQEALEALSTRHCDLILTDLQMPAMNGVELIKVLREREKTAGDTPIPIVVLSSEKDEMVDAALQLGVDGYFAKSTSIETVVLKLQQLLAD